MRGRVTAARRAGDCKKGEGADRAALVSSGKIAAEVSAMERTMNGNLRQPRFLRWRSAGEG